MNEKGLHLIESLVASGAMEIEKQFAIAALQAYLHDLELVQLGVPFSELRSLVEKKKQTTAIFQENGTFLDYFSQNNTENTAYPPNSYAILTLSGVMRTESDFCTEGIRSLTQTIDDLSQNPNISGALLRVNSGGGESTAGLILKNSVADFVATGKPFIVHTDFLGSAALRGTLPASEIIASGEGVGVGSIGTYISLNKKFMEWYKANVEDIYAEQSSEKNAAFRQYLEGNTEVLKKEVSDMAALFQKEVQKYRPITDPESTLAGGVFMASEAKRRGLIDSIGSLGYAKNRLRSHIKNSTFNIKKKSK